MAPPAARMSLPAILNECQKTAAVEVHRKYARLLSQRRRDQPAELAVELLGLMRHAFVVSKVRHSALGASPAGISRVRTAQREPAVERLVRFVVVLANERDADEAHEDDDAFLEELLWALLPLSEAADKSVRFRVCQLIASLLHGLSNDTGLADELYAELVSAMTERLRDRAPAARMQAARALARLQARRTLEMRCRSRPAPPRSSAAVAPAHALVAHHMRVAPRRTPERPATSPTTLPRLRCCPCLSATSTRTCDAPWSHPLACRSSPSPLWWSARATALTMCAAPRSSLSLTRFRFLRSPSPSARRCFVAAWPNASTTCAKPRLSCLASSSKVRPL